VVTDVSGKIIGSYLQGYRNVDNQISTDAA